MCSADVFLGLLALLFPPLPGESRALLPLKLGAPLPPSSSRLFGGTRCLVDAGPPAAAGLIANHVCSHSMGEVRHLLRRLRHQHPALCSGLRQYPPEPPAGIRILTLRTNHPSPFPGPRSSARMVHHRQVPRTQLLRLRARRRVGARRSRGACRSSRGWRGAADSAPCRRPRPATEASSAAVQHDLRYQRPGQRRRRAAAAATLPRCRGWA